MFFSHTQKGLWTAAMKDRYLNFIKEDRAIKLKVP